jgi:hypothetical protein
MVLKIATLVLMLVVGSVTPAFAVVTQVPEPGTSALLLVAAGVGAYALRKRRK